MRTTPYAEYTQHVEQARAAWKVTQDWLSSQVRYVEAEADTGSRYTVTTTVLPAGAALLAGGPILVTVTAPWIAAYFLQSGGELHSSYVAEKFAPAGRDWPLHGGDLAALTLTIAYALDRDAVLR